MKIKSRIGKLIDTLEFWNTYESGIPGDLRWSIQGILSNLGTFYRTLLVI